MLKLMDPTPSDEKIRRRYLTISKDKRPVLLTTTAEKYELTLKETLLLKFGLTSVKTIDRRQTRIARFHAIKMNVCYRIKKKKKITPFFWKDPISLKPVLFTSVGVVYKLSFIDRLMLKLKKTNIVKLNERVVFGSVTDSILTSDVSLTKSKREYVDNMDHFNSYIRGYGDFFESR